MQATSFEGTASDLGAMMAAAGIDVSGAEAAAKRVAAAPPSAPSDACSDPSCTIDHGHGGHDHAHDGHDHGHGHDHGGHDHGGHDHGDGHDHGGHDHGGHDHGHDHGDGHDHGGLDHGDGHDHGVYDHGDGHDHGGHDHGDGHDHGGHDHGHDHEHSHNHGPIQTASAPTVAPPPPKGFKRVAYIDAFGGVAGDMLLAACVDAGAPLEGVVEGLESIKDVLGEWRLECHKVSESVWSV